MYKLKIMEEAKSSLKSIENYIISEYDNPAAAKRIMVLFRKGFKRVREQPFSCPVFQSEISKEHEYRKLIVHNYVVFYTIDEERRIVIIARVFHCKQDYENNI
ncbi:MAG: type II toxin-antitoxin system RelE/ParE family toxin [Oscillospiraceae bacterium]|nr:type II toxin-antitoxin system RelE/ParE family toxin [Oscillospiraceae bacterium]